jgi:CheY-like chemotaxis protein
VLTSGDPLRIEQILVNLLSNAARYTESSGQMEVTLRRTEDGEHAELRIRDDGVGMTEEMLAHVFDLFGQAERGLDRAQGGLGIGLTITRSLVQLHGGRIEAFSDGPQCGSEFVVTLPLLAPAPAAPTSTPAAGHAGDVSRRRILVVDDNVDVAVSLKLLLQGSGHEVAVAHDGAAALAQAETFGPELVLLDIGLPGMDGYEVARRLRDNPRTCDAALIALTGYGQPRDRELTAEAGFDHHLVKPVDVGTLEACVESLGARQR